MAKVMTTRPVMVMAYGFPGSGKSYFSRQLADLIGAAYIHGDKIRDQLFEKPRYDQQENEIIEHLTLYMAEEFLSAGVSVVYDVDISKALKRRELRDLARKAKAQPVMIWLQIDQESSLARLKHRDKRKADDKYAREYTKEAYKDAVNSMQNLQTTEDYIVISGKHTFNTQRNAVIKRMYEIGLINADSFSHGVAMPGLVNLIPRNSGRVDMSRRNIVIR